MRVLIAVPFVLLILAAAPAHAQNLPGGVKGIGPALTGTPDGRQNRAVVPRQQPLPSTPPGLDPGARAKVKGEEAPTHCSARIITPDPNYTSNMRAVKPDQDIHFELRIVQVPACPTVDR